jgi:hypothetical protein
VLQNTRGLELGAPNAQDISRIKIHYLAGEMGTMLPMHRKFVEVANRGEK